MESRNCLDLRFSVPILKENKMKKKFEFDNPCFYCNEGKDCGKYNLFFFKPPKCTKKFKKIIWVIFTMIKFLIPLTMLAAIIAIVVLFLSWIDGGKDQQKHDYLEVAHILVEGDENSVNLKTVKFIEKSGFEINKIIVVDCNNFIFETERKNTKYMWVVNGCNTTVFPLIEDHDKY